MKISISIFLGLALIAGAIYYKPSFACSTGNICAVLKNDTITYSNGDNLIWSRTLRSIPEPK